MTTAAPAKIPASREPRPYVHPYLGGMFLGIVLFLATFLTGNGLGSSGATSRLAVFVEDLVAPTHVDNTPYLLKMAGGDKDPQIGRAHV